MTTESAFDVLALHQAIGILRTAFATCHQAQGMLHLMSALRYLRKQMAECQ